MKFLILVAVVGFFAITPVYLYESLVTPQLNSLATQYSQFDQVAQDVAAGKTVQAAEPIQIPSFLQ